MALSLSASLSGCGSSSEILAQTKQCTVDAECSGNGWCLEGVCQLAYGLTLTSTATPKEDGKYYVNGVLRLGVQVTNGSPGGVEIQLDGVRIQLVGAPYAYDWTPAAAIDGAHQLRAVVRAGSRTYVSGELGVVVDHAAPNEPVVNPVASPTRSVTLGGTAEANATLKVYEGGTVVRTSTVPAGETWSLALTGLADGLHSLTVSATDWAGNESVPRPVPDFVVDTVGPVVPVIDAIPPVVGQAAVTVTGRAEAGSTVALFDQGIAAGTPVKASAGSTWSVPLTLADGGHVLTATATDDAGNASGTSLPVSFTVSMAGVSLNGPTLTREFSVPFGGTAPAGATVQVLEGTTVLATVTAHANSAWEASIALQERAYDLFARAGSLSSSPLHVVVDRTNLGVDSQVPAPGTPAALNVDWRAPITIRFKEAMDKNSLSNPANVTLTAGGLQLSKTLTPSADGTALEIQVTSPPSASEVTVTLGTQITDLAGNPLPKANWSLTCPEWLDLANPVWVSSVSPTEAYKVVVAVDGSGNPTVALSNVDGRMPTASGSHVYRWNGTAWSDLGFGSGQVGALILDGQGRPLITRTLTTTSPRVYAERWDGPSWASLGTVAEASYFGAYDFYSLSALRLDGSGAPFAVYDGNGNTVVSAKHRTGATWTAVDSGTIYTTTGRVRDLEAFVEAGDVLRASWSEYSSAGAPVAVYRWKAGTTASRCFDFPALATNASIGPVRMDSSGNHPAAVHIDQTTGVAVIRVWQYSSPLGEGCGASSFWNTVGGNFALNVNAGASAQGAALAIDGNGHPVVAWGESPNLYAKRWTGAAWTQLGSASIDTTSLNSSHAAALAIGPGGHIVVAWLANSPSVTRVLSVKRYNR